MNSFRWFPVLQNLPLIPMQVYEALTRLCSGYPERALVRLSAFLGQPQILRRSSHAQYWAGYQPFRTPASICDATAMWLWNCLEKSRPGPRLIVEFGTGFSTLVMAAYAQHKLFDAGERVVILSVEHDEKWFESQRAVLSKLNLLDQVYLIHCPLEVHACFGEHALWYSGLDQVIDQLSPNSKADFVFVDGPVGLRHGGVGRRGSILQSISLVREGGFILIHDALRSEEFGYIREFQRTYPQHFVCRGIVPLYRGLAVCKKKGLQG
jgi:predicted O-methyltransferase YrrM